MTNALALAVLLLLGDPEPVATAAAAPKPQLREIGHVKALSPFCSALEHHFNGAVRPMLDNDVRIGAIDYTLGALGKHFRDPGRELELTSDRQNLAAYAGAIESGAPALQREIDALRAAEKLTTDPEEAKLAHELAAQLQKSLDRQRQIAFDTSGVAQALLEGSPSSKMLGDSMDGVFQAFSADTRQQEQLETADADAHATAAGTTQRGWTDVRDYLRLQRQLDRIGDAESAAAVLGDRAFDRCSQ